MKSNIIVIMILFLLFTYMSKCFGLDLKGNLNIKTNSIGDTVFINGIAVGVAPLDKSISVPSGTHLIKLNNIEKYVTVGPSQNISVDMDKKEKKVRKTSRIGLILGITLSVLCGFSLLLLYGISNAIS